MNKNNLSHIQSEICKLISQTDNFSEREKSEVTELVDHGEYGLALETYADIAKEEDKPISSEQVSSMARICAMMNMDIERLMSRLGNNRIPLDKVQTLKRIEQICWHAGLFSPCNDIYETQGVLPVAELFYQQRKGKVVEMETSFLHLLSCLEGINHIYNGDKPSLNADKENWFDRRIVFAMSKIVCHAIETAIHSKSSDLLMLTWRISFLWQAIAAGDIDDLGSDLANDETNRFHR